MYHTFVRTLSGAMYLLRWSRESGNFYVSSWGSSGPDGDLRNVLTSPVLPVVGERMTFRSQGSMAPFRWTSNVTYWETSRIDRPMLTITSHDFVDADVNPFLEEDVVVIVPHYESTPTPVVPVDGQGNVVDYLDPILDLGTDAYPKGDITPTPWWV